MNKNHRKFGGRWSLNSSYRAKVRTPWCGIKDLVGPGPALLPALLASTLFSAPAALAKLHFICLYCIVCTVLSLSGNLAFPLPKFQPKCTITHPHWQQTLPGPNSTITHNAYSFPLHSAISPSSWELYSRFTFVFLIWCPPRGGCCRSNCSAVWCNCCLCSLLRIVHVHLDAEEDYFPVFLATRCGMCLVLA